MGRKYEENHPGAFERIHCVRENGRNCPDLLHLRHHGPAQRRHDQPRGLDRFRRIYSCPCAISATGTMSSVIFRPAWVGESFSTTVPHLVRGLKLNTLEEPETLFHDITEITPNLILGGPRQWEGWVSKIRAKIDEAGSLEKAGLSHAYADRAEGRQSQCRREKGVPGNTPAYQFVDWVLLQAIRDKLGFTKGKFCHDGRVPHWNGYHGLHQFPGGEPAADLRQHGRGHDLGPPGGRNPADHRRTAAPGGGSPGGRGRGISHPQPLPVCRLS